MPRGERVRRRLLSLLLLAIPAGAQAAFSNLTVTVQDVAGSTVPSAQVIALSFNNGKPDPAVSTLSYTDATGSVVLPLVDGYSYQVFATSQGFSPTILDQFGSNIPPVTASGSPLSRTIRLRPSSGVGVISLPITGATASSIVFGQVGRKTGGGASAFGLMATDGGTGDGTMLFLNVTTVTTPIYQVSAYDPVTDRSTGTPVNTAVGAGGLTLGALSLSITQAQRPMTNIGQAQTGGGAGLSVYGIATDTSPAANPIPYLQLNFQSRSTDTYGQQVNDWRGTQTDQNGIFQLYDLRPGNAYYASIFGTCDYSNGVCYQGWQSTAAASGGVPAVNDFFYPSSTTILHPQIKLSQFPPSNGAMDIIVKDQYGNVFPQVWVGMFPDGMPWQTTGGGFCGGPYSPNPGFKNTNTAAPSGTVSVTGLPSGNYNLQVWTPYGGTSFNAGADGKTDYSLQCSVTGSRADDLRLSVDTTSLSGQMAGIYDVFGNVVSSGLPSVTVTVSVSTGATGLIKGTLTFPGVVNLSASPISIVLYPKCQNNSGPCTGGGFTAFNATSTGPTVNYAIPVSSGQAYWMQVLSDFWGPVYPGGNQPQPDLSNTSSATINMSFFPSGRVTGSLRKPDGSLYVPPTGNNSGGTPGVNAEGNNSWGHTQINADGTFTIGGLLPGIYTLAVQAEGNSQFSYTTKQPAPKVTATVNSTISQDVYLADAVTVRPQVNSDFLPSPGPNLPITCPANFQGGDCPPETWKTYALPQGTPFTPQTVTTLLAGGGDKTPGLFNYSKATGTVQSNGCYGQFISTSGFCSTDLAASKNGSTYDFYLLRSGSFDSDGLAGGIRPYFVIESSTKSVLVQSVYATTPTYSTMGSTTMVQAVPVTPTTSLFSLQQATMTGTITATNMINQRQFQSLGGNFDKFMDYLPTVFVYDAAGALKASGLVVPSPLNMVKGSPTSIGLDNAVATGNFSAFIALTGSVASGGWGPLGFDIRGLTAKTQYSVVINSPNYPPYKTSVTLGAAGSDTTLDVNLDANAGATLNGVVRSTNNVNLDGAQVTVKAPGYGPTTLTTDSSGTWSLSGLGVGQYQVSVVAAGYAQAAAGASITGTGSVSVPAFVLRLAGASISGTVYTNNPVCPAGATCSAFGKTVLQGIPVLAYDDTLNATDPTGELVLYRSVTDSSGAYKLSGLTVDGHRFKVFANAPGYFVVNSTVDAVGAVTGFDFALNPKPLDVGIFGRPAGDVYEFQITNYEDFSDGNAWVGASPFVMATSTPLPQSAFFKRPDADGDPELFLSYSTATLVTGTVYTLHIEAQPNDPRAAKVIKEVPFGLGLPHAVCQSVDQALIGDEDETDARGVANNVVPLDIQGGNNSGLAMPVGGLIPTYSTAIPSMCMSETDATSSQYATSAIRTRGLSRAAFASGVYDVSLSSISYTAKGVDLTLYYDQVGTSLDDIALYHYNNATLAWEMVPGLQTIDPVKGTISVKGLKSLASVLALGGSKTAGGLPAKGALAFQALSDGRGYRPSATSGSDSGIYAVLKPSQVNGGTYSGTTVKVFNFPNPFNLQPKSVTLSATSSCSGGSGTIVTGGTFIKYEVPADISGKGVIRIYTVSGRLVRELDAGPISPSSCYYIQWDGRNSRGQPVANGVYYGILSVGGSAQTSATFKLAVIK